MVSWYMEAPNRMPAWYQPLRADDLAAQAVDAQLRAAFPNWWRFLQPSYHQAQTDKAGLLLWLHRLPPILPDYLRIEDALTGIAGALARRNDRVGRVHAVAEQLAATQATIADGLAFVDGLFPEYGIGAERPAGEQSIADLCAWLDTRLHKLDHLEEWVAFAATRRRCTARGMGPFVQAAIEQQFPPDQLPLIFRKRFLRLWMAAVEELEPVLGEFRGTQHSAAIQEFRALDRRHPDVARDVIRARLAARRPRSRWLDAASAETTVLDRELAKQRRHLPIRQLFQRIPGLPRDLKPCLLMSPLSVSNYLDPRALQFDLVIFDEASQITPEDAVGAIMRGKQVIVVGDDKQMPPTSFFTSQVLGGDDDGGDADDAVADFESILKEAGTIGLPPKTLRWHYRSRHESLIAFSNAVFYDNQLVTFPSALASGPDIGIAFVHVPDGNYQRGRSGGAGATNPREAERVAGLVFSHADRYPHADGQAGRRSLGVVSFSISQQHAIEDEIERLRKERARDPEQRARDEAFFDEGRQEPFFVKNLETVQGDERDVMFFSVGYGKDAEGRLSHNFGPLNRAGGGRRLNVAVTRARYHIKVVSSIQATDIDPSRVSRDGGLLRLYLDYAQRGPVALPEAVAVDPTAQADSPFEVAVYDALTAEGLTLHQQVGCSGYRIDLAVVDPAAPGRYLLGIECDGATYHAHRTARERDRLRQQVLEGLGWRIHRVWSPDWWRDPAGEVAKVLESLRAAPPPPPPPPPVPTVPITPPPPPPTSEPRPETGLPPGVTVYRHMPVRPWASPEQFYDAPPGRLIEVLSQIVLVEGPVHVDVAARRLIAFWGMRQAGSRIKRMVQEIAARAAHQGRIRVAGDFLWPPTMTVAPMRTPGPGEDARPIEHVALEEIAQAALICVREARSISVDDLVRATARLLGFDRTGDRVRTRITQAVEMLVRRRDIDGDGTAVRLPVK